MVVSVNGRGESRRRIGSAAGGSQRAVSRRRFLSGAAAVAGAVMVPPDAAGGGIGRLLHGLPGTASGTGGPGGQPVTLTVDAAARGYAIPAGYAGLSFERGPLFSGNAGVAGYLFSPSNTELITLFTNAGIKSLRIGGGSVDDEIPAGTGADGYTGIDNLFAFAGEAGVRVLYSLRLLNQVSQRNPDLEPQDVAIARHIWERHRPHLSSFAIGNEPDWHSYHTYLNRLEDPLIYETVSGVPGTAYPSYLADWRDFAGAIRGGAPGATFSGPDTGSYTTQTYTPDPAGGVSWTQQFAEDERQSGLIADITQHYYVGGSPGVTTAQQAIDNMLSADWVTNTAIATQPAGPASATTTYVPYPWLYANNVSPVVSAGLPYRLTESNDYLTGVPGASNGFASALWTLDYMHWWAAHRAAGVNFHNKQWIYTDTIVPEPGAGGPPYRSFAVTPKAYGIRAFDLGAQGEVKPVAIANSAGVNVTAYAVGDGQDLYVTIINKTQGAGATDAGVTIVSTGARPAAAEAMVLTNGTPGDASQSGTTLGGESITNAGGWHGRWDPVPPDSRGQVALTVRATTAAIVRVHMAG